MAFISIVHGDMEVTFKNDTPEYVFYLGTDYIEVPPNGKHTLTLSEHESVTVGMDSLKNPSLWKFYGLGFGGVSYSTDPVSGQSNFSFGIGPALVQPVPSTPAPTIVLSGGVNMEGVDDWGKGISLQPHGTSDPTTVTLKSK